MYRRTLFKIGMGGILGTMFPTTTGKCSEQSSKNFGWLPSNTSSNKLTLNDQISKGFRESGKDKIILLYKYLELALRGKVEPYTQEGPDCVGVAAAMAVDILMATQIYLQNSKEKFEARASSEAIYGGARYEIGYKVHDAAELLKKGGAVTDHCVEFLRDYGVLVRKKYGKIDLRNYSLEKTIVWGQKGIPDHLESIAKRHPVRSFALMESYKDCRDAIANGYPIIFGSKYGFNVGCNHNPNGRDEMGFLKTCGEWAHSMCGIGVDDTDRPGILIINSNGSNWVQGPKRFDQPDGSFWVDAATIDGMCSGMRSSFAISNFVGFPKNILYNILKK